MRPPTSQSPDRNTPSIDDLIRVGNEYADLFNTSPMAEIERFISDACVDPMWDDRTNLYLMLADDPEDLALVLAGDRDHYVVVRYIGKWLVDADPVDWEELEDLAFGPVSDDEL
jgi:hypothetical protein